MKTIPRGALLSPLWKASASTMDSGDQITLARELGAQACNYAWASAYVEELASGDDAEGAAKKATKYLKRVRKAMGYTYP